MPDPRLSSYDLDDYLARKYGALFPVACLPNAGTRFDGRRGYRFRDVPILPVPDLRNRTDITRGLHHWPPKIMRELAARLIPLLDAGMVTVRQEEGRDLGAYDVALQPDGRIIIWCE